MLKSLLPFSALMLLAVAPAFISGQAAPAPAAAPVKGPVAAGAKSPITPTTASLNEAKTVYGRDCALCHGDNGNGKTDLATSMQLTMSDWTDSKSLAAKPDGELFNMIRVGDSKMPGEDAGRAKDNVVWNLIYYIRGFSKTQAAVPRAVETKSNPPASNQ